MRNRRELWRAFMSRFEPAADPRDAIARGFYVPRPGKGIGAELASRFEVKPSASHLLVGGIGSGKTTQLLVARDALAANDDVLATYIDVSLTLDPANLSWFALVALVGMALVKSVADEEKGQAIPVPGVFNIALDHDDRFEDPEALEIDLTAALGEVVSRAARRYDQSRDVVVLIDSLDRMTDLARFGEIVTSALPVLRQAGLGVIIVGPLTSIYGLQGAIVDRFDRFHHLPVVNVQTDAKGLDFLLTVIRARDPDNLIDTATAFKLALFSGGVLRDLVALAQLAGEEAYVDGADRVELHHVKSAADIFGRRQMTALDSEQVTRLLLVRKNGTFVQMSEKDLALLSTRRVLEYPSGSPRFAVHPTMEALLAQVAHAG